MSTRENTRDMRDMSFRELGVRADGADKPVRAILTTEQPVEMYDWERGEFVPEVLLMSGMELPETRQIPLLDCHQRWTIKDQLGSVVDIRTNQEGESVQYEFADGELRFADTEDGRDAETKVRGGHVTDTSVGYKILETTYVGKGETSIVGGKSFAGPVNVRTKWRLNEDSLCPIGADDLAKVRGYRSMEDALNHFKNRNDSSGEGLTPDASSTGDDKPAAEKTDRTHTNTKPNQTKSMSDTNHTQDFDENAARLKIEESISKRNAEILEIGKRVGDEAWAFDQIAKGRKLEEVKDAALDKMAERSTTVQTQPERGESLDLSEKQLRSYDFAGALRDIAAGKRVDSKHSFAGEVSDFIGNRSGKGTDGLFIPSDFDYRGRQSGQRDLLAGTATDGAELVPTEHGSDRFVPVLRPSPIMTQLGAQVITGVTGNWEVPRETSTPSATTKAEAVAHTESESQFDTISYTPHAYGFFTEVSDRLIRQGSPAVTQIITNAMNREVMIKMDADGINGSGTNAATGIVNTSGVGTVTVTTAGQPDFDEILDYEADVATANAENGSLAYLTTYAIRKFLKKTAEYGTDRDAIWNRMNEVNGYRAAASNQVPTNELIYGDFSRYWFCVWDGIEIVRTKDSAQATKRMTQFTVNYDLDGHLTNASAMSITA